MKPEPGWRYSHSDDGIGRYEALFVYRSKHGQDTLFAYDHARNEVVRFYLPSLVLVRKSKPSRKDKTNAIEEFVRYIQSFLSFYSGRLGAESDFSRNLAAEVVSECRQLLKNARELA